MENKIEIETKEGLLMVSWPLEVFIEIEEYYFDRINFGGIHIFSTKNKKNGGKKCVEIKLQILSKKDAIFFIDFIYLLYKYEVIKEDYFKKYLEKVNNYFFSLTPLTREKTLA